jgi:hypothetical protein
VRLVPTLALSDDEVTLGGVVKVTASVGTARERREKGGATVCLPLKHCKLDV